MKKTVGLLLLSVLVSCMDHNSMKENNTLDMAKVSIQESKEKALLRHVVLFKFKEGTSKAAVDSITSTFAALPAKIKEIESFEWGLNNSPENLNKGFTHCFFVSFASEEARDIYLPHPDHQEFVALLSPYLEDVLVVDYWIE